EPGERLVVRAPAHDGLIRAHLDAVDRRDIRRRRQIVDDGVEKRLHPFVLERRAAQDRNESAVDRALADALLERLLARLLATEIRLERRIILLDGGFHEFRAKR